MTEPSPLSYESVAPDNVIDRSHLRILSICHYIWGGLIAALSCIFIMHVVLGLLMASGRLTPGNSLSPPPPPWAGYAMASMGGCAILLGWTLGILNILSGRFIAQYRRQTFSLVIAGINCLSIPFGTLLGIFTFIVLLRPSMRMIYTGTNPQST